MKKIHSIFVLCISILVITLLLAACASTGNAEMQTETDDQDVMTVEEEKEPEEKEAAAEAEDAEAAENTEEADDAETEEAEAEEIKHHPMTIPTVDASGAWVVYLEAEDAVIEEPLAVQEDANASGGKFVASSVRDKGTVSFEFEVPETGTYVIYGRTHAPGWESDSYFVSVDGGQEDVYDMAEKLWAPNWQWTKVNARGEVGKPAAVPVRYLLLDKGKHTVSFRSREIGSKLDKIAVTNYIEPVKIQIEAETAERIAPATVGLDQGASEGVYVYSPTKDEGAVIFNVTLPLQGEWVIWGRILAPDSSVDSWYVSIDDGQEDVYDTAEQMWSPNWQWTVINGRGGGKPAAISPRIFKLDSGSHSIKFRGRDPNSALDMILITNDLTYQPTDVPLKEEE